MPNSKETQVSEKNMYTMDFSDNLPEALKRDVQVKALSCVIANQLQQTNKNINCASIYARIAELPEEIVDILAFDMHADWYKSFYPLEAKQRILKDSVKVHKKTGTKYAVEELVEAVFGKGKVKEWFEYGDAPFYFKIETDAIMTQEMNDFFADMIQHVKNTRSHLRAIEIDRKTSQVTYTGGASYSWSKPAAILDGYEYARKTAQDIYTGAGIRPQIQKAAAILEN